MKPAIEVENLSKCYRIGRDQAGGGYRTFRDVLAGMAMAPIRRLRGRGDDSFTEFWALKDVSFDVKPGEVVGVVGRNGAGKSTLLKIISRITRPTRGTARLHGRVGSLLEVGTGFHPELTGRENVFLNGAILGMSRDEIKSKFDEIVAFAGVEQFLDTPIKRYSSGMYVRLAFAVAAHLEPEILLVDEVLAVGDQAFQKKCIGRMGEIASSGRTIILVSHDLPMLSRLCTRAVWINKGTVERCGPPAEVIDTYCQSLNSAAGNEASTDLQRHPNRRPGMRPILRRVSLFDEQNRLTTTFRLGGAITIEVELGGIKAESGTQVIMHVCDVFGTSLAQVHSQVQGTLDLSGRTDMVVRCQIDDVRLLPAEYTLNVIVSDGSNPMDRIDNAMGFSMVAADLYGTGRLPLRKDGPMALSARWEVQDEARSRATVDTSVAV